MRPCLHALGCKPWDIDRMTMREHDEMVEGYLWSQEQPGSNAWLLACWLRVTGSQIPWTARTVLGRPDHG